MFVDGSLEDLETQRIVIVTLTDKKKVVGSFRVLCAKRGQFTIMKPHFDEIVAKMCEKHNAHEIATAILVYCTQTDSGEVYGPHEARRLRCSTPPLVRYEIVSMKNADIMAAIVPISEEQLRETIAKQLKGEQ